MQCIYIIDLFYVKNMQNKRASDSMFLCIDFVRVTNCFYDYDYDYDNQLKV